VALKARVIRVAPDTYGCVLMGRTCWRAILYFSEWHVIVLEPDVAAVDELQLLLLEALGQAVQ
jgi:hypothetical protein